MEALVEDALSLVESRRKQGLEGLVVEIRKSKGVLAISNLSRFFTMLKDRFLDTDWDSLILTLQVVQEIIPNFGPDLESNFFPLLPTLVVLMADNRSGINKLAKNILTLYIKTTRNVESVISGIIKHGLSHEDWKIRHKTLLEIIPFINLDLNFTLNNQEMKRILERVISLIKDTSVQVSDSAKEVAAGLKDLCYDFSSVFSKLSFAYQQIFQEYCESIRGSTVLRGSFQRISEVPVKSIFENIEKPKAFAFHSGGLSSIATGLTQTYVESSKNSLVFGFIPAELMQQLEDQENWRLRVSAVQELENLVLSLENFNNVLPYIAVLLRFLTKLLEDTNFKVSISALNIVKEIISVSGVLQQSNIGQILPVCINKLGDNKIAVRQSTFRLFMCMFKYCKARVITVVIFPQLCEALTNQNWHIREEVVIIILASALEGVDFDYLSIVPDLAKLLDDSKTKIRFATMETFAVLAQKWQKELISILKPIVDENAMSALNQRFQYKALPILTEDYVEFPKTFPSSAPAISSPYITVNTFNNSFNKTVEVINLSKKIESMTPSTINSSMSPISVVKFKRLRPSSESNFSVEETIIRSPKKIFTLKNDKTTNKPNYQSRFMMKQAQEKSPTIVINKAKEDISIASQSSPTIPKPKPNEYPSEEPVYLAVEDLKRLTNPEEALQRCIVAGNLESWSEQFEALNTLRRLLKHHPDVFLSQVTLHNICLDLIKFADSLRSSLSKNSLIVIGEMCESLGRTLDSEIVEILKILIKKAIDTNIFLSEQAEVAIESMCKYSNETKIINSLISIANSNKNPLSRAKVASCLTKLFKRMQYGVTKCRDIEKLLLILSEYLTDANFDVRNNSKEAIIAFSDCFPSEIDLEKLITHSVNDSNAKKLFEVISNKSTANRASPLKLTENSRFRSTQQSSNGSRNSRMRPIPVSQGVPELDNLTKISAELASPEWKVRYNSIGNLLDLTLETAPVLKNSGKLLNIIDLYCKGLSDQNLKVHIHTLNALAKVTPVLGRILDPHLTLIFTGLLPGLGSANSSIREIARDLSHIIVLNCEGPAIVTAITNSIMNSNARARTSLIIIITDLIPSVYDKRPNIISKNVVPIAIKLIEDSKIDVREESSRLIVKIYSVMGSTFFEALPSGKSQKVLEILNDGM